MKEFLKQFYMYSLSEAVSSDSVGGELWSVSEAHPKMGVQFHVRARIKATIERF
jgi:hypothetical protein